MNYHHLCQHLPIHTVHIINHHTSTPKESNNHPITWSNHCNNPFSMGEKSERPCGTNPGESKSEWNPTHRSTGCLKLIKYYYSFHIYATRIWNESSYFILPSHCKIIISIAIYREMSQNYFIIKCVIPSLQNHNFFKNHCANHKCNNIMYHTIVHKSKCSLHKCKFNCHICTTFIS